MRVEFLPSIDFNQMLVYSTFVHLFFLTWLMFVPDSITQEQIVVPTFRLDLIELPPKAKSGSLPKKKITIKKKRIVKKLKRSKAKQLPPPKTFIKESKIRKKIIEDLSSLESNLPKKSALKELDLLARLPQKPQEKKIAPPKAMQEETFNEVEKESKIELSIEKKPIELPRPLDEVKTSDKERELIALSEQLVKLNLNNEVQSTSTLIEDLEAIDKKEIHSEDILLEGDHFEKSNSPSAFKNIKGESLVSVVEKFQDLENSSEEIKIDISQGQLLSPKKFKTSIQRNRDAVSETKSESKVSSNLSLYVGEIYTRVYSKWKTPLGPKFKDVEVSFTIFSKGNINNPTVHKSSGDKNLDSIAVRAIIDAVPFPDLPQELDRSNLKINIVFKYVLEKK